MSLVIPFVFTGGIGNLAFASQVNACFAAVAGKFTTGPGGIGDQDISNQCDMNAAKLSATPGKRVVATRLEDDAVDQRVLKDDATAGAPNAAVNRAEHIRDGIITLAKLVAAIRFGKDRLKNTIYTGAFSFANGTGGDANFTTSYITITGLPAANSGVLFLQPYITGISIASGSYHIQAVSFAHNSSTSITVAILWSTSAGVGANFSFTINVPVLEAASV